MEDIIARLAYLLLWPVAAITTVCAVEPLAIQLLLP
jgi:hypothetical protein